jgi:hypothetical protein
VESVAPPEGIAGVVVVGEVIQVRDALAAASPHEGGHYVRLSEDGDDVASERVADEVKYGR